MGEIGRNIQESLYKMTYCDIILIIRGYHRRNILQYQLQRMQIHAATFCMGNPKNVKPTDIVHLYFDDYKGQNDPLPPQLSVSEREELQAQIDALNFKYENQRKNHH